MGLLTHRAADRAILVGLRLPRQKRWEVEESMEELARLTESAGAQVLATVLQEREAPSPPLHFGRGKVEEVRDLARTLGATLLISDDTLTPGQERNVSPGVVFQLGGHGPLYVAGYCHLRRAQRVFRVDRVELAAEETSIICIAE